MLSDKEVVLQAIEMVGKWDVMLAGTKGNEILIVSKRECPNSLSIDGRNLNVKRYDPDTYINILQEDENVFRNYKVYYFVKVYMRKILDLLAYLEVSRLSMDFKTLE